MPVASLVDICVCPLLTAEKWENVMQREPEIRRRAQREAARHCKSDWRTVEGLKFLSQQSRGPNATALSYTCIASAILNLGGSK